MDDGLIENINTEDLQKDLDIIIKLFEKVGLKTNENKTKCMIIRGTPAPRAQCTYIDNKDGLKYTEWRQQQTQCNICKKTMKKGSLQRHMEQQHQMKPEEYLYRKRGTTPTTFL